MKWEELVTRAVKPAALYKGTLVTFDPGETTGWSLWTNNTLSEAGQIKTWPIPNAVTEFYEILRRAPSLVVFEEYRIYSWKAEDHIQSDVPALQVIGCLKTLLHLQDIPFHTQTAQVAKQFCTDVKIQEWGLWQTGMKHARDAIRHGCYYQLFGKGGK